MATSSFPANPKHCDSVTVGIHHLSLDLGCPLLDNNTTNLLFVEYHSLLGVPAKETETPYSLKKLPANEKLCYNYVKTYSVDYENHYERREYLASMLLPDDPEKGRLRFILVSEPPEEESDYDHDCRDIAVAFVSLHDILNNGQDVVEEDIPIFDLDTEQTCYGSLNVTVKCLDVLQAIKLEMSD